MVTEPFYSLADTISSERAPSTNYTSRKTLTVRNASGFRLFTYLQVRGLPIGRPGAIVERADLVMYPTSSFGATTFVLRRPDKAWTPSTLRWNNQPGPGPSNTRTASGTRNRPMRFDVTNFVAAWVNGTQPNTGIRIEVSDSAAISRDFHSMNGSNLYQPWLEVSISFPPEPPVDIQPSSGTVSVANPVVSWRYAGELIEPLAAYQLQTSTTNVWTSPASDTGWVDAVEPRHQLSGVTADGVWFRIRQRSEDGRVSGWSQPQQIFLAARPSVTITSTEATTSDPTPTTTWTVAGGTQTQFQVILRRLDTEGVVANSGTLIGADTDWAPSSPVNVPATVDLSREVRVWDDVDRVATAGQPAYTRATFSPFRIVPSAGVDPVANLTASTPIGPVVEVAWTRSSTPDSYIVERRIDDGAWKRFEVEPGDVALGGGAYRWRDVTAPAEHDLTYRVRPVVNRVLGEAPAEATTRLRRGLIWLTDPDDPAWLFPVAGGDQVEWTYGEDSAVHVVPGSDRAFLVHEGFRGAAGTVSGALLSDVALSGFVSAAELEQRFYELKRQPTHIWRLFVGNKNIPVWVREAQKVDRPGAELSFGTSFEFGQYGELEWEQ